MLLYILRKAKISCIKKCYKNSRLHETLGLIREGGRGVLGLSTARLRGDRGCYWGGWGLDQIWALRETENEQLYDLKPNQLGANTSFNHSCYHHIVFCIVSILFTNIITIIINFSSILIIFLIKETC